MISSLHPTKRTLVKSAVKLLETSAPEDITSEQILADSGISKGSLYHHFADFPDLIEQAQVYMFSRYVGFSVEAINTLLHNATDRESILAGLREISRASQAPSLNRMRAIRISAIAKSVRIDRMRNLMGAEQERLTDALADLYRESQERGWGNPRLDPKTVAVFIQSYTIGKVLDDLTPQRMDEEKWYFLIDKILETILFPPHLGGVSA